MKPSEIPDILQDIEGKISRCVCTLRPKNEGGKFSGKENERISIIKLISEYNPFLLDVEFNTLKKNQKLRQYLKKSNTDILVSWHDFKKTPSANSLNSRLKEMKKLSLVFDGVKDMKGLPDAIFVIDVENEKIAVQEAQKMGIPVYGLVDTNSNPKNLTNFVPINDDSSKTIKFVLNLLAEAVLEGQDSARKQGLVQKLDGDKGPKVFSLNSSTKKVSDTFTLKPIVGQPTLVITDNSDGNEDATDLGSSDKEAKIGDIVTLRGTNFGPNEEIGIDFGNQSIFAVQKTLS